MSVRLFSKKYIQFGFLWLKKKVLTILPKAFYAVVHLEEPSLSLFPPSVEFILYKVSRLFYFYCKCRFCWLEITTSVSPVLWEMPSLFGTLKLLNVNLSLGGFKVTVSGANVCCQHGVVLNVELLFGAHVSWIVFSAFYFQGSQSCCLSLTTVCPHSKWASALGTEEQEGAAEGSGCGDVAFLTHG